MMTSCIVPKSDDNQAVSNGFTIELKLEKDILCKIPILTIYSYFREQSINLRRRIMGSLKETYVKLDGHIVVKKDGGHVPHKEFLHEFTRWLESSGYGWTGSSVQVDQDGNSIDDIG